MSTSRSAQPLLTTVFAMLVLHPGCGGDGAATGETKAAGGQKQISPLADSTPPVEGVPRLLSLTGLFADIRHFLPAPGVVFYTPKYPLWADGAQKNRWFRLPPGTQIDTGDMDHWSVPVGMRFWKEFQEKGRPVETRMITRFGPGPEDFTYAVYQWNAAGDDAVYVADGVQNAGGTGHDIPAARLCVECHGRLREHVLGFSAYQLSHTLPGASITTLSRDGLLTQPAPDGFMVPGDAVAAAALGYLHGNCGYCHNPDGVVFTTPYVLRLPVSVTKVEETGAYQTAVGVATERFHAAGITYRIAPGDPSGSALFYRMSSRGNGDQMPPVATSLPDPAALGWLHAWISSLPQH